MELGTGDVPRFTAEEEKAFAAELAENPARDALRDWFTALEKLEEFIERLTRD